MPRRASRTGPGPGMTSHTGGQLSRSPESHTDATDIRLSGWRVCPAGGGGVRDLSPDGLTLVTSAELAASQACELTQDLAPGPAAGPGGCLLKMSTLSQVQGSVSLWIFKPLQPGCGHREAARRLQHCSRGSGQSQRPGGPRDAPLSAIVSSPHRGHSGGGGGGSSRSSGRAHSRAAPQGSVGDAHSKAEPTPGRGAGVPGVGCALRAALGRGPG